LRAPRKDAREYDIQKCIPEPFTGTEVNKFEKYYHFRHNWDRHATIMQSQENGDDKVNLFSKLSLVVTGEAWEAIKNLSLSDPGSYEAALKQLHNQWGDPMNYTKSLTRSLLDFSGTDKEWSLKHQQTLQALRGHTAQMVTEGINPREYVHVVIWEDQMYKEGKKRAYQAWMAYKEDLKQKYLREGRQWQHGLPYTYDEMDTWLKKHNARQNPDAPGTPSSSGVDTSAYGQGNSHGFLANRTGSNKTKGKFNFPDPPCPLCDGKHTFKKCPTMWDMAPWEARKCCSHPCTP